MFVYNWIDVDIELRLCFEFCLLEKKQIVCYDFNLTHFFSSKKFGQAVFIFKGLKIVSKHSY